MRLSVARIGYGSYSSDFSAPGDRRRFSAYAGLRRLHYGRAALDRDYDLVYLTHNSDLPGWLARKRVQGDRLKLVFELIDSYFTLTGKFRSVAKGVARRVMGTDSRAIPAFNTALVRMCEAADAVVCSTLEQKATILRFNPNVHLSFDYFGNDVGAPKSEHARGPKLKLVWEGQSTTVPNLQVIREPLNALRDRVALHVVTDPLIYRHFGRFGARDSMEALAGIECEKHFHPWQRSTFSNLVTACDVAVIPINPCNILWMGKPENKLILLWKLGMPVLTGTTAAYLRVMADSGLDMACQNDGEWVDRLVELIESGPDDLERLGRAGRDYAERVYSDARFIKQFDRVFDSVGFDA